MFPFIIFVLLVPGLGGMQPAPTVGPPFNQPPAPAMAQAQASKMVVSTAPLITPSSQPSLVSTVTTGPGPAQGQLPQQPAQQQPIPPQMVLQTLLMLTLYLSVFF